MDINSISVNIYPVLSQRDPKWASKSIGYSPETIGRYGCLFMDLLMIVTHDQAWKDIYIDTFMSCLKGHNNYMPNGGAFLMSFNIAQCCPKEWGSVTWKQTTATYNGPFPAIEQEVLLAHLRNGQPAILEVDPTPGSPGIGDGNTHFVLAISADGSAGSPEPMQGMVTIHDPWFGDVAPLCPRYGHDNATAIYRAVYYEVSDPKAMELAA